MRKGRILSFKYAFSGIWSALKEEPNMKFHFLAALAAIAIGFYLNISSQEWLFIILAIGIVITLELTNTAIETVIDSFTTDYHPGAKRAKDIASGAVLISSITALLIGLLIFLPYLSKLFT